MKFLGSDKIIAINKFVIEKFSPDEKHVVINMDILESAVFCPWATFGGADCYPTIFSKSAALLK